MIKNDIYNNFCANSSADIYTRFIVDANRVIGNFLIQKCWTKVVFFKNKNAEACVAEVMRLSCTAPLTVDHKTLVDSNIAGYRIPKGTVVCTPL